MKFIRFRNPIFVFLFVFVCQISVFAQQPQETELAKYIKENYTKREVMIPMRDGVKLFTSIYEPKNQTQKYPIMFDRTPYTVSPYGVDKFKGQLGPSELFTREGYIFVYQDVRGKWMSEGVFEDVRPDIDNKTPKDIDESTDTYDTIEWLIKNVANNNGRVGMWGISYPGFYTSAGAIDSHPALKAISPQAPVSDWFQRRRYAPQRRVISGAKLCVFPIHSGNFVPRRIMILRLSLNRGKVAYTPDGYDYLLKTLGGLKEVSRLLSKPRSARASNFGTK